MIPDMTFAIETPLGCLVGEARADTLLSLAFESRPRIATRVPQAIQHAVDAWFDGNPEPMAALPADPAGTHFQQTVWRMLRQVPWGKTMTYRELAERLDRSQEAARAVGAAVARNPIALAIPCHRVLGSDGALTGFAWGIERKRALLRLEGYRLAEQRSLFGQARV